MSATQLRPMQSPGFVPAEDSSAVLVKSVRNGDTERFYELVRPYERNFYLTALAITGNHADAEEVVQESVLKAFTHLDQFRGESKFSTWLTRIVVNEARGLLRRQRRFLYEPIEQELPNGRVVQREFADPRETPSQTLERHEVSGLVDKAMDLLPLKYREIFVLRDLEKLSITQTAKRLGVTRSTVKARLWRARLKMRRMIAGRLSCGRRTLASAAQK